MQQTPNPFGNPFPGLPLPGLDPAAIMQLLSGSASYPGLQQKQQLDAALLHQQLQQASELQKPGNLPSFQNNNRGGRFNNGPSQPPTQNDANSDRKRVSFSLRKKLIAFCPDLELSLYIPVLRTLQKERPQLQIAVSHSSVSCRQTNVPG